jgi:hypothetical protein
LYRSNGTNTIPTIEGDVMKPNDRLDLDLDLSSPLAA